MPGFNKKCRIFVLILHFHALQKKFFFLYLRLVFFIFPTNPPSLSVLCRSRRIFTRPPGKKLLHIFAHFQQDKRNAPPARIMAAISREDFFGIRALFFITSEPAKCQTFQKYVLLAFFVRTANHTRATMASTITAKIGIGIATA